jgi:bacterioferritin-associated ferredoxin
MKSTDSNYLAGYRQADADNMTARAGLLEAITEARREADDTRSHETTRAYWRQKAKRWQGNLAETRALALNHAMAQPDDIFTKLLTNLKMITDLAERYGVGNDCDGNIIEAREVIAQAEGRLVIVRGAPTLPDGWELRFYREADGHGYDLLRPDGVVESAGCNDGSYSDDELATVEREWTEFCARLAGGILK